jgi:hypothetical protein
MIAIPILYHVGSNVALLYPTVFVVYWCCGTQLSVNASTTADFWGAEERRHQLRDVVHRVGRSRHHWSPHRRVLFDKYKNYQMAFYSAAVLAAVALICELAARRPAVPQSGLAGKKVSAVA